VSAVRFVERALPEFDSPPQVPEIDAAVYRRRYEQLERAREAAGFDWLAIYADREHSANLAWLTGFDPRFEEALWIQGLSTTPVLLAGNENVSFARAQLRIATDVILYQGFSLPNQDRSRGADLRSVLRYARVRRGARCGLIGWKAQPEPEVPYWIVRAIEDLTGAVPANATAVLTDPDQGLRVSLEPEMIRFCEYAASLTSTAIRHWVRNLREGISERDAAAHLNAMGLELSCHTMMNFGRPIPSGLRSARNARARRGDYAQAAFGVIGGLTCRAGRLIDAGAAAGSGGAGAGTGGAGAGAGGGGASDPDRYLALVENYLRVVHAWYRSVAVGAVAGKVVAAATAVKSDDWDFAVNAGHLIHLEEWMSSPFFAGSTIKLKSGSAIQQDIIPVPREGLAVVNMEDGFVLADGDLQERLRRMDSALLERCRARRAWMEGLGYALSPDILPLSNIAGTYFPFLLDNRIVAAFT
jgi:hypothetical protein